MLRGNRAEPVDLKETRRDTEFTLGPALLIGIFCALVLLCGLCFGIGYSAGRRSGAANAATVTETATGQTMTAPPGGSLAKPTARSTMPAATVSQKTADAAPTEAADGSAARDPSTANAPAATTPSAASASAGSGSPSPVHPALPQSGGPTGNGVASGVQQAPGQGSGVMVQIAAVSHAEDATVLVNALRKRGYAVTARRQLGDELIHVQIGPFANRSDANAMSQKLLGDGYNAVVIP